MSEIPSTSMKPAEFRRVFGFRPYDFQPSEVVVDVGSGTSELGSTIQDGFVVQIDPIYSTFPAESLIVMDGGTQSLRVPLGLGVRTPQTKDVLSVVEGLNPTRTTVANTLRYLTDSEKIILLQQMLEITKEGLVQVYPFPFAERFKIAKTAEDLGLAMSIEKVGLVGIRQLAYRAVGINATLTIESPSKPMSPNKRGKLAAVIAKCIPRALN